MNLEELKKANLEELSLELLEEILDDALNTEASCEETPDEGWDTDIEEEMAEAQETIDLCRELIKEKGH